MVKALEEEKADQLAIEAAIKKEVMDQSKQEALVEIVSYGMSFRRYVVFMIRKKYLDLFDVG